MADAVLKVDARVQRTHLRLREALVDLVLERGFDNVTIKDIVRRADIGYATFFRHYQDKEELLRSLLDDLLARLMQILAPSLADEDASRTGSLIFEHVGQNTDLYRVLVNSQRSVDLLSRAMTLGAVEIRRVHVPRDDALLPPDAAVNHLVHSVVALIEWWLDAQPRPDTGRMGAAFEVLIMAPVRAVAYQRLDGPRAS